MEPTDKTYLKYKICVSGAAETGHCNSEEVLEIARELGKEIVRHGAVLVTGATTGFPFWAAKGAKEEGGISIGLSPASSEREHIADYKLPTEYFDIIVYTGFGYSGRNLLLTRSSDAVIVGCGRIGTVNEFTIAFEDEKPLGVLEGPWATDEVVKHIVKEGHRPNDKLVYDADPKQMVEKILELVKKEKVIEVKDNK
ncbi:MAG: hypothetical protein ABII97_01905 [Patescibacteria group bacterium]